jgi:propanol-preferring alcohol dehydrogenase
MRAMVLEHPGRPLTLRCLPVPQPGPGQIRLRVAACAVCRTDLHVVDGDLPDAKPCLIPGHEIVGRVEALGPGVEGFREGDRVGVPWLGFTCGVCRFCLQGRENLCAAARFTGYQLDGGYAEHVVADARFCLPIPETYSDVEAAPLLCAGLIGHRALRMAGEARRLGLYGFGAAAHIVAQVARHEGRRVFAFTRPGDAAAQAFARALGAEWAGGSDERPPEPLDAAIIFAPVGALIPAALRAVRSVANLTRRDGAEFLALAPRVPVRTEVETLPLERANEALARLREGRVTGALVLVP